MANSPAHRLLVKCPNPADYTLSAIVSTPRTSTPLNLTAACQNLELEDSTQNTPTLVKACVQYLLSDFFLLAHRTGLYNRQPAVWEALSRVTSVEVIRQQQGFFQRVDLPILELHFNDSKGQTAILANLIEDIEYFADDRKQRDYFKTLRSRAEKLKSSKGLSGGLVIFAPESFPENLLTDVQKQTSGEDPVGKYECLLPDPLAMSIDLIEYSSNADDEQTGFQLIYPQIATAART